MSRTITAFFDSRSEAEAARTRLSESSIDAESVRIVDKNETGAGGEGQGFWASLKSAFLPEEDGHAYDEGLRRGGFLLCAEVDEDQADRACRLLEQSGSVDFDGRQDEWKSEGWSPYAGTGAQGFERTETSGAVEEERIPLIEEEMRVGKREVERGGARVRSYVTETPVREQVDLREEHVSVERRPVDRTLERGELDSDSDLLRDRTIEMTETAEEAVVDKEARVREELVLKKTADQRTETVEDTVRKTEVEVDDVGRDDRPAFGSFGGTERERGSDFERGETERSESFESGDKDRF